MERKVKYTNIAYIIDLDRETEQEKTIGAHHYSTYQIEH
jgi:hypothetical protein